MRAVYPHVEDLQQRSRLPSRSSAMWSRAGAGADLRLSHLAEAAVQRRTSAQAIVEHSARRAGQS